MKLLGRIAAGQPIEAVEQHDDLTFREWPDTGDKFVLRVTGDSMIEAHIADGDFVVIKKQEHARDGQIVAVLDDDGGATLKRLFRDKNRVRLEPANRDDEGDLSRPRQCSGSARGSGPEVLRFALTAPGKRPIKAADPRAAPVP